MFVTDADGRRIPWTDASRFNYDEMCEVVSRIFTFQLRLGDPEFQACIDRQLTSTRNWDEPSLHPGLAGNALRDSVK